MEINNLISVIIPAYNAEDTIDRAVKSVLSQSYKNIECVVVDDGSTDRTAYILDEMAGKDKRVKVCHIENGGVSNARNIGLVSARGDYIAFLDSDDWMESGMLERLVKSMTNSNSQMVVCGYVMHCVSGEKCFSLNQIKEGGYEGKKFAETFKYLVVNYYMNAVWNKLYKRELIDFYFDIKVSLAEDFLFNLQYMEHITKISVVSGEWYHYNRAEDGNTLTDKMPANRLYVVKENYQRAVELYEKNGGDDSSQIKDFCARQCIAVLAGLNRIEVSSWEIRKKIISDCFEDEFLWSCLREYKPKQFSLRIAMVVIRLRMKWFINFCNLLLG